MPHRRDTKYAASPRWRPGEPPITGREALRNADTFADDAEAEISPMLSFDYGFGYIYALRAPPHMRILMRPEI